MIRINLLPAEERPTTRSFSLPKSPVMLAVGLFLLVASPIAVTAIKQQSTVSGLREAVTEAKEESERLKPEIEKINRLNQQTRELNHRIRVVSDLDKGSTYYVEMLDQLSQMLPKHMWLTKVEEDESRPGVATIEGYTFTNLLVADLMVRLEKAGYFDDVVLVVIERKLIEGREALQFEIEARLTFSTDKEESRELP
jgi:Tfp pilus assembly protein PilN